MTIFLNSQNSDFEKDFKKLLSSKREDNLDVDLSVREIIKAVIEKGDQALIDYTQKFDRISLTSDNLRFTQSEIEEQAAKATDKDRKALELAAARIEAYHKKQLPDNAFWIDESGVGLTKKICEKFFSSGVDVITTGNHVWDQKEIMNFIENEKRLLRPKNFFEPSLGRGFEIFTTSNNSKIGVLNLMGNVFMKKCDDVFSVAKEFLLKKKMKKDYDFLFVDFFTDCLLICC